jgi:hypothetical protein
VAGKRVISTDEQGDPLYEDVGATPRFMQLTRSYRQRLEANAPGAAPPKARKRSAAAQRPAAARPARKSAARRPRR